MKKFSKALLIISLASIFITATGCQEKEQASTSANNDLYSDRAASLNTTPNATIRTNTPRIIKTSGKVDPPKGDQASIKFESLVHDFGVMGPKSSKTYEFKFKNTGKATLKIPRTISTCGCTIARLDKKKFAPGESGVIKLTYRSDKEPMKVMKSITVITNDPLKPSVRLTIKVQVQIPIVVNPSPLKLRLDKDNAGAGDITITSKDGKPFSIRSFKTTNSTITADIDISKKAVKHTIKLKVNMALLENALRGKITINISHPVTQQVSLYYETPKRWKLSNQMINVLNPIPGKPVTRVIMVLSNYGEKVEIKSITSAKKCVKVISQEQRGNAVKLTLEVTPKKNKYNIYSFYDLLTINIVDGEKLTLIAKGYFINN